MVTEATKQGDEWPTVGKLLECTSGRPVKSQGKPGRGSQYLQLEDIGSTPTLPPPRLNNRSAEASHRNSLSQNLTLKITIAVYLTLQSYCSDEIWQSVGGYSVSRELPYKCRLLRVLLLRLIIFITVEVKFYSFRTATFSEAWSLIPQMEWILFSSRLSQHLVYTSLLTLDFRLWAPARQSTFSFFFFLPFCALHPIFILSTVLCTFKHFTNTCLD